MKTFRLGLLMVLAGTLLQGCAVYAPPPAYAPYPAYPAYPQAPAYQAAPAYAPVYAAPYPVYAPPVSIGLNFGFWSHRYGGGRHRH